MSKGKFEYWRTADGLTLLSGWARDGLSDEQIAHNCGVCRDTLYEWKRRFSDISDALKKSKEVVDLEVENALLKRAMGYDTVVEERVKYECGVETERAVVTKHIPPDTTAQIFWLKNRSPERWRDKQQVEANVDTDLHVTFDSSLEDFTG